MATDEVGQFIESLLPDETVRREILAALADSMVEAHRIHPDGWGVTLRRDRSQIRMNVGPIEVFVITSMEPVQIIVDGGRLPEQLPPTVRRFPLGEYDAVKEAIRVAMTPTDFAVVWNVLRPAHFAILRSAGDKRR